MKKLGLDVNEYEVVYSLSKAKLYYAFHINTSDELISSLQKALDTIKNEGKYQKVLNFYK